MAVELTIAGLVEGTAERVADRPAVVHSGGSLRYRDLVDRSRRLARYLLDQGLTVERERAELDGHECGQPLVAQYLYNGPEYLEGLLGCFRGRMAPFNVNYRYVADEVRDLMRDARPAAVQYHASFAPTLAKALADLDHVPVLLQINDGSGHELLPGAVDYETALASVPAAVEVEPSPDDLYVVYTGGTTGTPKGVLWRQADAAVALFGMRNRRLDREWESVDERLAAISPRVQRVMALAPFIHGTSQFTALQTLCEGNTVVIPDEVRRFDPADALATVARHEVTAMVIVGDAFGRPLADEFDAHPRELPSLRHLFSGGAALNPACRGRLAAHLPGTTIIESIGSSETGVQGRAGEAGAPRTFAARETTAVISEDRTGLFEPGHPGVGWLATSGRIPLGYLGHPEQSARTFPTVAGRRLSVPGDRARLLAGGLVELLGRDSTTINTGGEKVFAEEVEAALREHPDVLDAVVCGRPSERWGSEVVALVRPRPPGRLTAATLIEHCVEKLARYKLPKAVIFVDEVRRSESGKPDQRWAAARASQGDPLPAEIEAPTPPSTWGEDSLIRYSVAAGVAHIELNRPETLNSLTAEMAGMLLAAVRSASADPKVRAVLISGAGRGFSAGTDVKDPNRPTMPNGDPDLTSRLRDIYKPALLEIRSMPKPVIAAVHGVCAGVVSGIALACDMVLAGESAYLMLPFVRLGLMPDGGVLWFLAERIGLPRAAQLAMLGERLPARTAVQWGVFNEVYPDAELMPAARALAERLAIGPTLALANIKRTLNDVAKAGLADYLDREGERQQQHAGSFDYAEGKAAFVEKRPAVFQGR